MEPRDFKDPKYVRWRKAIFARDKFTCQMPGCPRATRSLNAHHIKRWASFPQLRYVVANGISLCRTCHQRVCGREEEFEPTLMGIVANKQGGDVRLAFLMMKHSEAKNDGDGEAEGELEVPGPA